VAIITITEKCVGCGICIKVCPQKILKLDDKKKIHVLDQSKCMSCYGCEDECKFKAVLNKKALFPHIPADKIKTDQCSKLKTNYDVAIVGAGPAGLGAAISCARNGLRTAVFERLPSREVSHHNDGGVLFCISSVTSMNKTENFLEFPELNLKLNNSFIDSQMDWLGLYGPNGYKFDDKFKKGMIGYICSKDKFVKELANKAQSEGAELLYGTRVEDVIKAKDQIVGVKLNDGTEVRADVVVAADGILGEFSAKAGIPVNEHAEEYLQYLTLYYERPPKVKSGFAYLFGDLNLDTGFPPAVGSLGVAEHIEVSLIMYSNDKFYHGNKPMEEYIKKIVATDERSRAYLGDHLDSLKLVNLRGTRLRLRSICKDIVSNGLVSIGDTWVSGAQLGNINALAQGIFTGNKLKKAFDCGDFSKDSLNSVASFIDKETEMTIRQMSKMVSYPAHMDDKTASKYCEIFHSMNYPTLFYGSKSQIGKMVIFCMLKNIFKLIKYPKIFKYL
jgi:flavin-dependent dehydrogenase/NAD-dependent dihydropyrimidine dehydrogenase PreA subunit